MSQKTQHSAHAKHAKNNSGKAKRVGITLLVVALLCTLGFAAYYFFFLQKATLPFLQNNAPQASQSDVTQKDENTNINTASSTLAAQPYNDRSTTAAQEKADREREESLRAAAEAEAAAHDGFPTPLIAEYDGVAIHSPIHTSELEAVLFHQASFETALVLSTQLPEANPETMLANPDYEISDEQPEGDEWLRAKALHLWREDTPTEMDTSIDVGAEAGTQVYAPVSGTVVLVRTYTLFDVCEDYEVHIQPTGRPDLDVVEIHIQDVSVKAGDKVVGGETPLAKVRDLTAEDITDIQLAFYTKQGHGNHTHVQVNNADYPEYRETRLKDAYVVKD